MPQNETNSELYSRLLFAKKLGYPLFQPTLSDDLPQDRQQWGVKIGDVGVVTRDGNFDPIFNIRFDSNDKVMNPNGVPASFERVVIPRERRPFPRCTSFLHKGEEICSNTATKSGASVTVSMGPVGGSDASYTRSDNAKALLTLPDGASHWRLRLLHIFEDYATKHALDWYIFVKHKLGRPVGLGDLYLVTETVKAKSWSIRVDHFPSIQ